MEFYVADGAGTLLADDDGRMQQKFANGIDKMADTGTPQAPVSAPPSVPPAPAPSVSSEEDEKLCRFCFEEEEGELIAPCACKGGQKYVHLSCLRRWQRNCHSRLIRRSIIDVKRFICNALQDAVHQSASDAARVDGIVYRVGTSGAHRACLRHRRSPRLFRRVGSAN